MSIDGQSLSVINIPAERLINVYAFPCVIKLAQMKINWSGSNLWKVIYNASESCYYYHENPFSNIMSDAIFLK